MKADALDRAKDLEMQGRQIAIDAQLAKGKKSYGEPLFVNGEQCCIDCYEPIPKARLQKRPESVLCVECKTKREIKQGQYK